MVNYDKFPPVASGTLDAWVTVASANEEAVRAVLPEGYDLVPPSGVRPGSHPVVILAGAQKNVRSRFNPKFWTSYLEAGIIIPWVRCAGVVGSNGSLFRTSLFLDQELPVLLGRCLGLRKTRAVIARDQFCMQVETTNERIIFEASFQPKGDFAACSTVSCYGLIERIFEQFHVGHALNSDSLPIVCVCCDLNLGSAFVRPVNAEFMIHDDFCRATPIEFGVAAIRDGPAGAFQLRADWTMHMVWSPSGGSWTGNDGSP